MSDKSDNVPVYDAFEKMHLKEEILKGIYKQGYSKPSPIQQRAIVPISEGRDVIAQSQSGTGKTATFSTGVLQLVEPQKREVQVIIVSPTRELATQSENVIEGLSQYLTISVRACVGGKSEKEDVKAIERGCQVVSGTPGRLLTLIKKRVLAVKFVKVIVLDEADQMLDKGFTRAIYDIFKYLPERRQIVLCSATLTPEVLEIASLLMKNPLRILTKREKVTLDIIKQYYVKLAREDQKFDTLCEIYDTMTITQSVIFCNMRKKVDWLTENMLKANFPVISMHAEMPQEEREYVMNVFRKGEKRVLITTDIWARGIDVTQISLVVNYDFPNNREVYVHRIGRSGRFGRNGVAINFVLDSEMNELKDLMDYYSTKINVLPENFADL
ncbi:DEAD box ATP-dependent RNA helicase, putative [Entamoeba invadens IP1]|uniref:RNA helicase n=1 Tax=Entamoeba invadens IP1 TaxID=370355 RepID=A0A0A1U7R4_ENTIV|nr:DEAD box ATP-dependent RNA helicase, putative [Entamoeba invadens IP1]ELP90897.1 DEAD box ATP-dependent RNA helicase, putative [Entamoeba invadens IP1]|eukprot:XP_004257668.1 DEAD box ATP-dependent RNA helicase, putative [Entamoeba invadens IP1]